MRPGQNKRLRGRSSNNQGRKGPNPLTRSFESNGPDVKVRGTAQHVAEKYLQLARDAQSSGDPVMAEGYLQHAEHYYRVIAAAHQAQQQAMGYPSKVAQEVEDEDDGIEEDDRFASVADRLPQAPQPQQPAPLPYMGHPQNPGPSYQPGQPNGGGQYGERAPYQGGGQQRPWRDNRQDNRDNRDNRQEPRQDSRQEPRQDTRQEPRQDARQDTRQEPRQEPRQDNRETRQDHRGENRGGENRANETRDESSDRQDRGERQGQNAGQPNANQAWRNESRRRDQRPEGDEAAVEALPAFITGGVRPASESAQAAPEGDASGQENAEGGYHLRPRRRRRGRPGGASEQFGEGNEAAGNDEIVPASE